MPFRTKRVKEPREPEDGTRVLVMALWPRGVKKSHVDAWERGLAPDVDEMREFLAGQVTWSAYKRSYVKRVEKDAQDKLAELRSRSEKGETITLLCWCPDESRCHRSALREVLERGERAR